MNAQQAEADKRSFKPHEALFTLAPPSVSEPVAPVRCDPAGPTRPPGSLIEDPELHIHVGGKMGPGKWKRRRPVVIAASLAAAGALALAACGTTGGGATSLTAAESPVRTTTPIKHVVVLFRP
jgi:hypothetical protein